MVILISTWIKVYRADVRVDIVFLISTSISTSYLYPMSMSSLIPVGFPMSTHHWLCPALSVSVLFSEFRAETIRK
jgi:hypothetical protein